ncbi:MAG: T9SS C-terminal target domain-containing protein [Chitinophagaceae bacterium]|nr:MAG: T9SS C-terminal target domain-containing protein [Chitinophagaceae bacterium]
MKLLKFTYFFVFLLLLTFTTSKLSAQCTAQQPPELSGDTICGSGSVTLEVQGSEVSWFDMETGGNLLDTGNIFVTPVLTETTSYFVTLGGSEETDLETPALFGSTFPGNMIEIVALENVEILSFEVYLTTSTNYEIYYKQGSFQGFEQTPSAWTLVGSAFVTANPQDILTPVPIDVNVSIPAGDNYSFYLTSTSGNVQRYTSGTGLGNIHVQDDNIQLLEATGNQYPFTNPLSPRRWSGKINYIQNCQTDPVEAEIIVSPFPETNITSADTTVCGGIVFQAGSDKDVVIWNDQITDSLFEVNTSQLVTVLAENVYGCISRDTIDVTVNPVPVVDLGADIEICGGPVFVDAANEGADFMWSDGSNSQILEATESNVYTVVVTNEFNCSATDSINLLIKEKPELTVNQPEESFCDDDPVFNLNQLVTPIGGIYQGFGVTSNNFNPSFTGPGEYQVIYTVQSLTNDCFSRDTIRIVVDNCTFIGEADFSESELKIYPNPASDYFIIEENSGESIKNIYISDIKGRVIESFALNNYFTEHTIQVNHLAPGEYFVITESSGKLQVSKLIIRR